jgi:exopolysaccharide biosynthesis protein
MKDISEFRPAFGAVGHTGRGATYPWIIARREKAVLWMTGDNLINSERDEKGILIRDGRLFADANVEDTLAIYPDMSMRIFSKWETRAGTLLEDGVENTFSFGPTLIRDGVINEDAKYHRVRRRNPRAGIGYVEPGHYIAIVVDGRQKDYSVGMTVTEFAELFAEYDVELAYNLDGGLSAAMIFMGEQINTHSGNRIGADNDISYQRAVPDGLMFGYSELVPDETDPIYNSGNKN